MGTEVTLRLSSNVIGNFNGKTSFLHKLLLTNTQASRFRKVLAHNSTANVNYLK